MRSTPRCSCRHALALVAAAAITVSASPGAQQSRPNVLFVIIDDLRPNLATYNNRSYMHTPNLDALAARSMVFERAYTNYAYCNPSRNSLMSGRLPDTTRVWNFINSFRDGTVKDGAGKTGLEWVTLPEHFKDGGYWTVGSGKMFHPSLPPDNDNPRSWSVNITDPGANVGCGCPESGVPGAPMYCELPDDTQCPDVVIADTVSKQLLAWNTSHRSQPFFAGAGIHKPHLPWGVPKRFFDLYPPAASLPLAEYPLEPVGMPAVAYHHCQWGPFPYNSSKGVPVAATIAHQARRAYYAAITFTDHLVGQVLATVRAIGEEDNTIVLFTSDHGWLLGEHNEWCKETNFENALRIPFMVHSPAASFRAGRTRAFVENIDIYRTLSQLAGLRDPEAGVQGVSLADVVLGASEAGPKPAAFSQHAHCLLDPKTNATIDPFKQADSCTMTPRSQLQYMGYSIRTDAWRYTEWVGWDGNALRPRFDRLNATELYDHRETPGGARDGDFDAWENVNLAQQANKTAVTQALSKQLRAHFG